MKWVFQRFSSPFHIFILNYCYNIWIIVPGSMRYNHFKSTVSVISLHSFSTNQRVKNHDDQINFHRNCCAGIVLRQSWHNEEDRGSSENMELWCCLLGGDQCCEAQADGDRSDGEMYAGAYQSPHEGSVTSNHSQKTSKVVRIIFFCAFPIFFSKLKIEGILDQIF